MRLDLYKEILLKVLEKEDIEVTFENIEINPIKIVELASYNALQKIKTIIEDNSLDDRECFLKLKK